MNPRNLSKAILLANKKGHYGRVREICRAMGLPYETRAVANKALSDWYASRPYAYSKQGGSRVTITRFDTPVQCCGRTPQIHRVVLHVDHVKPRHFFPELALEITNLQVLCEDCNKGKGAWDQTDWRNREPTPSDLKIGPSASAHPKATRQAGVRESAVPGRESGHGSQPINQIGGSVAHEAGGSGSGEISKP